MNGNWYNGGLEYARYGNEFENKRESLFSESKSQILWYFKMMWVVLLLSCGSLQTV